jgi:hypothetical protein
LLKKLQDKKMPSGLVTWPRKLLLRLLDNFEEALSLRLFVNGSFKLPQNTKA